MDFLQSKIHKSTSLGRSLTPRLSLCSSLSQTVCQQVVDVLPFLLRPPIGSNSWILARFLGRETPFLPPVPCQIYGETEHLGELVARCILVTRSKASLA